MDADRRGSGADLKDEIPDALPEGELETEEGGMGSALSQDLWAVVKSYQGSGVTQFEVLGAIVSTALHYFDRQLCARNSEDAEG